MESNITEANEIGSSSSCGTWSITEEEASYEYRLNSTWYTKAKVFDGYAHSAFVGFSQNRYNCHKINHIVDNVILPSLGVIGIIGNIFGIISFSKKAKQTYYFLLLTLAISDLITIIAFIVYYSFPHWHDHYTLLENPFYAYVILIAYGTLQVAQIIDIYLLIALSIERYLAICHPLKYRSRKVSPTYYILLVIILSLCYTIPLCLEHYVGNSEVEKFENKNGSRQFMTNTTLYIIAHTDLIRESCTYLVIYDIIFKLITKCFIPYILLLTTNLLMVRTFCKLKQTPKKEEQEEEEPLNNVHENIVAQDSMRIHTNSREIKIRQSQINLGYLNLSISVVFLSCLSIRWSWALFDLQYYISQEPCNEPPKNEFSDSDANPPWLIVAMNLYKVLWVFNSSINYYLYHFKTLISKGKSICCFKSKNNESCETEKMELQVTLSAKSSGTHKSRCHKSSSSGFQSQRSLQLQSQRSSFE